MAAVGDKIPDVEIKTPGVEGPESLSTGEFFAKGRTVLFGLPGAFTPGCDMAHLPGFVERADEQKEKGVDRIACVSVNDVFVMDAWAKSREVGDKIVMLADGNAAFTEALGLGFDGSNFGLGTRSKRYAAIIDDGVITNIAIDETGSVDESSCSAVLVRLEADLK